MAENEKVIFKYASNGIEQSPYAQPSGTREDAIAATEHGAYIIDSSAESLITHNREFPFMKLTDEFAVEGGNPSIGLSQAGATALYAEIIKDEETVSTAIHELYDKVEQANGIRTDITALEEKFE